MEAETMGAEMIIITLQDINEISKYLIVIIMLELWAIAGFLWGTFAVSVL